MLFRKEINPYSILTAEKVDPSNYEGTNFAVGGSIRSLNFYDIKEGDGMYLAPEDRIAVW